MSKIKEMSEGIVVEDAPPRKTTIDGVMAKGKRSATNGRYERLFCSFICHLACFCEVLTNTAAPLSNDEGMLIRPPENPIKSAINDKTRP